MEIKYKNTKFFKIKYQPQEAPSGVSEGHNMPYWEACRLRGPEILRVFSNWELTLHMAPNADMYENLVIPWVTPFFSILNLLIDQLPCKTFGLVSN